MGAGTKPLQGFIKHYVDDLLRVTERAAVKNADDAAARAGRQVSRNAELGFRPGRRMQRRMANDPKLRQEYIRQVRLQERGLNSMSVDDFLRNRRNFGEFGRGSGKAQREAREELLDQASDGILREMRRRNPGASPTDLDRMAREARELAGREVSGRNIDALHNPDMVAGGADRVHAFGDSGVNRSLGSGWKQQSGELDALERQLREGLATGRITPGDRMNVTLTPDL